MDSRQVAIVMPCLNEAAVLESTCASLGFGDMGLRQTSDVHLILVDNDSEDDTVERMRVIERASPSGHVHIVSEPERGYVPPRNRGVLVARELAAAAGVPERDYLVLQTDADTEYEPGYVEAMRRTAGAHAGNVLIEGVSHAPRAFDDAHPGYRTLCDHADAPVLPRCVPEIKDIIVGDNIAGYSVYDYFAWGGHRREYTSAGDEMHAETSRLFIKACLRGAQKVVADDAVGRPSRRRVIRTPVLHFATAGFPREEAWCERWSRCPHAEFSLDAFCRPDVATVFVEEIFLRRAHTIVLFALLPMIVASLSPRHADEFELDTALRALSGALPRFLPADIIGNTARFFEAGFAAIERERELFAEIIGSPETA